MQVKKDNMAFSGVTLGSPNNLMVGPPSTSSLGVGNQPVPRAGAAAEAIVQQLHGNYHEQAYRKNVFSTATQAVATTTVGLATTYTGLVISNPITSSIIMSINKASLMQSVIQATQPEAYAIAVGFNLTTNVTHTTPATVRNNYIGSSVVGQGLADTSATLPTAPTYYMFAQNTASATVLGPGSVIDLEGGLLLPPGAYAAWVTPAQASVAGLWFSWQWEEIPL